MTALPDWNIVSDAELAGAASAGDRAAFAGIYDRYADRLHDFCVGMLRDCDAAADCVQEVFCTAATDLPKLRDPDKLRPWLYAIARHEALRTIRDRRRELVSDEVPELASGDPGPDTLAARNELADLIAQAEGGISNRDRAVLELAYRHGLNGPDLAEALGVSTSSAKKMVQRLRETIERSLGALLVARSGRTAASGCGQLGAVLHDWDGQFTILMRKRIARHIESCASCDEDRRRPKNHHRQKNHHHRRRRRNHRRNHRRWGHFPRRSNRVPLPKRRHHHPSSKPVSRIVKNQSDFEGSVDFICRTQWVIVELNYSVYEVNQMSGRFNHDV